jgi:3-deoxy-D-manno-octulosonic acid (KDO) 8-phosphate synthase
MDTAGKQRHHVQPGHTVYFQVVGDKAELFQRHDFGLACNKGLEILAKVVWALLSSRTHSEVDIPAVAAIVDALQTPLLCRQILTLFMLWRNWQTRQ